MLEVILVVMRSEVGSIFDLGAILQDCLVDQLACESVPVADHIVSIDCSKNVIFLRPG